MPRRPPAVEPEGTVEDQPAADVLADRPDRLPDLPDPVRGTVFGRGDLIGGPLDRRPDRAVEPTDRGEARPDGVDVGPDRIELLLITGGVAEPDRGAGKVAGDAVDLPLVRRRLPTGRPDRADAGVGRIDGAVEEVERLVCQPGQPDLGAHRRGERRVPDPAEPVVELPVVPGRLGQRRRRSGDDTAGSRIGAGPHHPQRRGDPRLVRADGVRPTQFLAEGLVGSHQGGVPGRSPAGRRLGSEPHGESRPRIGHRTDLGPQRRSRRGGGRTGAGGHVHLGAVEPAPVADPGHGGGIEASELEDVAEHRCCTTGLRRPD